MTALSTNSVEVYNIPTPTKKKNGPPEASHLYTLDLPGHRSDIRTLCLSSDDQLLASASNGEFQRTLMQSYIALFMPCWSQGTLKIWNLKTTVCIRTLDCSYAICSTFLPGDRQVSHINAFSINILKYILLDCGRNKIGRSTAFWYRVFFFVRDYQGTFFNGLVNTSTPWWTGLSHW